MSAPIENRFESIQKGGTGLTGNWVDMWFVSGRAMKTAKFRALSDAKQYAIDVLGSSGKYARTQEARGPRGRVCAVYREKTV